MATNLIIGNTLYTTNNPTAGEYISISGSAGSYIAPTFWAYESQTINRIFFSTVNVGNTANYNVIVGIGTVDRNLGVPTAIGNTLVFNSFTTILGSNITPFTDYIVAIPDFTTTQLQKYYIGIGLTNSTGVGSTLQIVHRGINNAEDSRDTSPTVVNGLIDSNVTATGRFRYYNWGYDSGNAVTTWYNPFPGLGFTAPSTAISLTNMTGFTFTYDVDVDQIYVESVRVYLRNPHTNLNFPLGLGTTFHAVLYDSDGTTALVANTFISWSAVPSQIISLAMPIKSWIRKNKLYHFAFAGQSTSDPNNILLFNNSMRYDFQSNGMIGFTSIYFTKASGASAPTYSTNRAVPFNMMISDMRGTVQNGEGNPIVF